MTDAIDRALELLVEAEQLLPSWTIWAPDDHRPAEAARAARRVLEHPTRDTVLLACDASRAARHAAKAADTRRHARVATTAALAAAWAAAAYATTLAEGITS